MQKINLEKAFVVIDFDHTVTSKNSKTSWDVIGETKTLPKEYKEECLKAKDYYLPIEKSHNISFDEKARLMKKWYEDHLNLLVKYKLDKKSIDEIIFRKNSMTFRKSAQKFLKYSFEKNIPVIIVSAGIENAIEAFLEKNNCLYDNVYILSNKLKFKDGIVVGCENEVIHSLKKGDIDIPNNIKKLLKNRDNLILLGDNVSDILMADNYKYKKILKIGFLNIKSESYQEYLNNFDILYEGNDSFDKVINILEKEINN